MQAFNQPFVQSLEVQNGSGPLERRDRLSKSNASLLFCFGLAVLYSGLFLFYNKLRFPMIWDERHFLETSLLFSRSLIPDFKLLRNYGDLNTPLAFMVFGALEYFFRDGLFAGRLLNLILSLIMICSIGVRFGDQNKRSILAGIGLLSVPYYMWLSTHFYTDILAVFFVLAGFWLYVRSRHVMSGFCFVLAIASRQYMVAFPLAVAAYEFTSSFVTTVKTQGLKKALKPSLQSCVPWIVPSIAALTILCWFWLFNGMAPQSGIAIRRTPPVQREMWAVAVESSLYYLACVGLYFVVPEWILFSRRVNLKAFLTGKTAAIALGLSVLFAVFPPAITQGFLTKFANFLPVDFLRITLFCCLALLTCIRFGRLNLAFWVVLFNSGLMLKASAWDKYVLPLVVVFWYLKSMDKVDDVAVAVEDKLGDRVIPLPASRNSAELLESAR
jgi:hypothetical protein